MNVGGVLFHVLVVLVAAKAAAEVAERLRLPAVAGEIVAGILVGPSVLGLVGADEVLRTLGELGVILLLLQVGLELDIAELGAVGRASLSVAVVGVVAPFAAGTAVAIAAGQSTETAIFVGAALTATSVGITARVFGDLRALASVEARTVLGAAVADDVLGLVILTVVARVATEGTFSVGAVAIVVGSAVAFLVLTTGAAMRLAPAGVALVHRFSRTPGTVVALAFAFTLGLAELAGTARLAPIVGAFVAGLALSRSEHAEHIRRELTPVGHLLVPVFFLGIGIDADLAALAHADVLWLSAGLLVVAVLGKLVSGWVAGPRSGDRLLIGLGMLPRGEVGLIFAGLGLREGVLGDDLYGALVVVVLVTTLVAPPLLGRRLRRVRAEARGAGVTPSAEYGLRVEDGFVRLDGTPPPDRFADVALRAALLVTAARPSPELLDWLAAVGDEPVRWDRHATELLFAVLRRGTARSWRFLEAVGFLSRALPECAEALDRRRADPFELDPTGLHRWAVVERLHELLDDPAFVVVDSRVEHPDPLLLAAFALDAAGEDDTSVVAGRLATRLDLAPDAVEETVALVADRSLLRAAARRPDATAEPIVLQLAGHLGSASRAAALYLLTLAAGNDRARVEALYELVHAVLADGGDGVVERLRSEAMQLAESRGARERVAHAPRSVLLAEPPAVLARQAELLEPPPRRGAVHVAAHREADELWAVDVACRDRPGLLAVVTGVLAAAGLDVVHAVVATWPDGGALESFLVRAAGRPDETFLRAAVEAALRKPRSSPALADARLSFDADASPWHTICDVEGPDRPGFLHAVASAFAHAGVDVQALRADTVEGQARDRFEVTDRRGRKLDAATRAAVVEAMRSGAGRRRRRERSWHETETLG